MKISTYLRLVACLFVLLSFSFSSNAQSCNGNVLVDVNGYYGGFEAGTASIGSALGKTDLGYGSAHGNYQVIGAMNKSTAGVSGGGYLDMPTHAGNYMMLVHTSNERLWYKQVSVLPGQTLKFSAWIASAKPKPANGFDVRLLVKYGNSTSQMASSVAPKGAWSQISGTFTVPAGVSSVEVSVMDPNPDGPISNFLYLDDLCLTTANSVFPDINVTYVNVPVAGNVRTNDAVPAGATYGTPLAAVTNPAGATITLGSDGAYNFTANSTPGVYVYTVPVYTPSQTISSPTSLLTITVLEKAAMTNPPVAKTDFGVTKSGQRIILNTLANDAAGYIGGQLNPSSVAVMVAPKNGTASVNELTGSIEYTPAAGFSGNDTLLYRVSDQSSPAVLSATALQVITVKEMISINTTSADDDYAFTPQNTPVSGNVMLNDSDPESNTQTVTAQTVTIAGKGTLQLSTNGAFTFSPVSSFVGPVSFVYTICDNGTPQACANATIYVLVQPTAVTSPLPVRLSSFTAKAQGDKVALAWETASELNSSYFVVEYSTNGTSWKQLGTVKAAGNSNEKAAYSFTHAAPVKAANYYRLQLVDQNGSRAQSNVAVVRLSDAGVSVTNVYPNPFRESLQVTVTSEKAATVFLQILDINGRVMQRTEKSVSKGENGLKIEGLERLVRGTYFVNVTLGETTVTKKIFK